MSFKCVGILIILLLFTCQVFGTFQLSSLKGRIVNGKQVPVEKHPYHVSLIRAYSQEYYGAGVLLTPKFVVTAGHCIIGPEDYIQVVAGRSFLNETGVTRNVKRIEVHPDFDIFTLHNDIAVIELESPFTLSMRISTIRLASKRVPPLTKCTSVGFGAPYYNGPETTDELRDVTVPVQSNLRCQILFTKRLEIHDGQMCAGYITGRRDSCYGDSGGPFVCKGELGGVVSTGLYCARFHSPGIYTDVSYYKEWIESIVN